MKREGSVNGVPLYSDPDVPKGMIYFVNDGNIINRNPRRSGKLVGVCEPSKKLNWLQRIKWRLWDQI